LRERVVAAVASGMSREAAAERFQISLSSANRWVQRAAATGSAAALPMGGKKLFSLAEQADWINARIAEKPDITGRELLAELRERHVEVSYFAVWNFLDRSGLTFKKTLHAIEQDRRDVARRREIWKRLQGKVDSARPMSTPE
jgi:transposase